MNFDLQLCNDGPRLSQLCSLLCAHKTRRLQRWQRCVCHRNQIMLKLSRPDSVVQSKDGRGGVHAPGFRSIIVSGNKDSSTGPAPCDCRVPIPESRVSSGRSSPFLSQLSLGPCITTPATCPRGGMVGISTNWSIAGCTPALGDRLPCPGAGVIGLSNGCVPALGGGLPNPGVGVAGISTKRSVTGCVPALGCGLPCPGVGVVVVSMNRSVTGCVPAHCGGLPCPRVDVVRVSMNQSVTGCVPALGGGLSCPRIGMIGKLLVFELLV